MASFNKVILVGNLTRDPQLSYTASNTPVCKFGLATNRKWKSQTGEMREDTCFVDCTAFGRSGETINQYMSKGQQILVDGRLQFSQWEAQDGSKRSKLEVVVENFQFLGGPRGGESGGRPGGNRMDRATAPPSDDFDQSPPPGSEDVPF